MKQLFFFIFILFFFSACTGGIVRGSITNPKYDDVNLPPLTSYDLKVFEVSEEPPAPVVIGQQPLVNTTMLVGSEIKSAQINITTMGEGLASYEIKQLPLNQKFVIQFHATDKMHQSTPDFIRVNEEKKVVLKGAVFQTQKYASGADGTDMKATLNCSIFKTTVVNPITLLKSEVLPPK